MGSEFCEELCPLLPPIPELPDLRMTDPDPAVPRPPPPMIPLWMNLVLRAMVEEEVEETDEDGDLSEDGEGVVRSRW